jgi:hypothetical protein
MVRRFRKTCEKCRFSNREGGEVFPKICLGCRGNTIGALSEVNLIQIQFKNLLFRQDQFHLVGQNELTDFAVEGALGREKERPCQLLGNGAGPFDLAPSAHIRPSRTEHADVVETGMLEEPDILDRDDRTP